LVYILIFLIRKRRIFFMKRKIAAALSIVMIGASYAAPFVQAADAQQVTGTGSTAYVDDSVLTVVVPTSAALNFTLDPQGLVSLGESGDATATADKLNDFSGRILGNNALIFANKSLKDVTVTTNFSVSAGADYLAASGKTSLDEAKDSKNSDKANLIFMAVPNKDAIALSYADGEVAADSKTLAKVDEYTAGDFSGVAAGKGIVFTGTATSVKSVIPAAKYNFTYDKSEGYSYELDKTSTNSAAGFVIAGFCNPYYTGYSEIGDVAVTASYSFAATSDDDKTAGTMSGTYAVVEDSELTVGTPSSQVVTTLGATASTGADEKETHTAGTLTGTLKFDAAKSSTLASTFTCYVDKSYAALSSDTPLTIEASDGTAITPAASNITMKAATTDDDGCTVIEVKLAKLTTAKALALAEEENVKVTIKFGNVGYTATGTVPVSVAES
jgi:hypothetical protein